MDAVELVEIAPRDGLAGGGLALSPVDTIELVECLAAAGLRRIEAASFCPPFSPAAEQVLSALPRLPGLRYGALVPDQAALRQAAAYLDEAQFVLPATEDFAQRQEKRSQAELLAELAEVTKAGLEAGVPVSVGIAVAFGCPFAGEVPRAAVVELAGKVAGTGPAELSLADTLGVATPDQVRAMITEVRAAAPGIRLRCHFHNTRNTGYANAIAAVEAGVRVLDVSAGGFGGCRFAPGAAGNIATEDVVYALERMGIATGVDMIAVADTAGWLAQRLGRPVPALLGRAGMFPPTI
ncbi:hydroxymethylglutaryl-CoA lyase [Crossiella cryophila]|uniref:Hydroxymethylglutaryl-CoA lyase n=1 Tax=Crossiella cryophila TaxID=43355 RepID=A0A7W7FS56_9PSEU|nr:hydroxymethylglutaryl-CoA lyase [Crossiella cryophila]MBB4675802.1 hydroxymethylglutaryl-CoA lyase [Crossiella cryophila]